MHRSRITRSMRRSRSAGDSVAPEINNNLARVTGPLGAVVTMTFVRPWGV
jgi:hypothetical protein